MSEDLKEKFKELMQQSSSETNSIPQSTPPKSADIVKPPKEEPVQTMRGKQLFWLYILGIVLVLMIGYYLYSSRLTTNDHMNSIEDSINNLLSKDTEEEEEEEEEEEAEATTSKVSNINSSNSRVQEKEDTVADPFFQRLTLG